MIKVFLVEDESIVREGLRDNIPWGDYGYEFVGEASDGEMALPMIRKAKPDVLITDIKMPFMDGLALSRIVTQELKDIKIIIISGYDEFEYARQAIQVGAVQYLLKPITRSGLRKALDDVREKIEAEQEQKGYLEKYQVEMADYERYSQKLFLEKIFAGQLSPEQIYEESQKVSIALDGQAYNLCLVHVQLPSREDTILGKQSVDGFLYLQEELRRYFLRFPEYLDFRWNVNVFGVLVKGSLLEIEDITKRAMQNIERICALAEEKKYIADWHAASGQKVERLSKLPECYSLVNHILAYRFLVPDKHILSEKEIERFQPDQENSKLENLDSTMMDQEILKNFLKEGTVEEIDDFAEGYLRSMKEALESKIFRDYIILNFRFTTVAFAGSLGADQEAFWESVDKSIVKDATLSSEHVLQYIKVLLRQALDLRNQEHDNQGKQIMKKALQFIEDNYSDETLSLNMVSGAIGVSPNYFSGIFSQEMDTTFVEYVTRKRMEKAKHLLRQADLHTSQVAAQVGYKDPHYFSFVFKKTQGMTPREYRQKKQL